MTRNRSREAETEDVNARRLRRGAVKRQHISRWAVGAEEIAPGVIGDIHLGPNIINETNLSPELAGQLNNGAHIHLLLTEPQTVPVGGATVEFDLEWSTHPRANFDAPTLPVAEVAVLEPGYYNAGLTLELADDMGGTVTMYRTRAGLRVPVWGTADPGWSATSGTRFAGVAEAVELREGDTVSFEYDHGDSVDHDIDRALLALYLVDGVGAPGVGFLAAYNGATSAGVYSIGIAASGDATSWSAFAGNPVLAPTSGWESAHVKDPCLVIDGDGLVHMFYAGHNGTNWKIGHATSTDGQTWTRDAGNPVLSVGVAASFDENGVIFPTVVYDTTDTDDTRRWKMWYTGLAADGKYRGGYAYAAAPEGPYTKHGMVVDVGTGGAWDDEGVVLVTATKVGAEWVILYGGAPTFVPYTDGWQPGAVTCTDPEGTYTKDAGNPVFARRTTATQNLTSDLTTSDTTVTVADTSVFEVGEPVVIDSNNVADIWAAPYIVSIDSGTQLTISFGPTAGSLTVAEGAFIRSLFYGSLQPRSVARTSDGRWRIFGTAFQFAESSELAEAAVAWTADTLTTGWVEDNSVEFGDTANHRGIMFPFTSSWAARSAENPSVVVRDT